VTSSRFHGLLYGACGNAVVAAAGLFAAALPIACEAAYGVLPPPGSYKLDHIQRVPQAVVLEGTRFPQLLSRYTKDAVTLFGFFYSSCADPNGCPLAWEAFEKVRKEILTRPALHEHVRLVFVSLDPQRDTPEALSGFARRYAESSQSVPWHFLTTYSYFFLNPLLRDMGEEISYNADGQQGGAAINHLLKVFLLDKDGWVREIYSNQSLDPAAILGDIETLVLEEANGGGH
jgi:cytochrome oxidase Cu insertion factor (SCO1/SenC/PrrC family)